MGQLKNTLPLIASQAGVWDGEYHHIDANNKEIDRHQSRLICRLHDSEDGEASLSQSNIYTWPDGTQEIRYFEGILDADRLVIKNDILEGWTAPLDMDATNSTIFVHWTRPSEPGFRYYEMITVAEDGQSKNRTWHWYRNNELFQRTIINETRVDVDWQDYDRDEFLSFKPRSNQQVFALT